MDTQTPISLPEEDYLKIIQIIGDLRKCEAIDDLNEVLENSLLPLVRADMAGFVWSDKEFFRSKGARQRFINCVGIENKELEKTCLIKVGPYHKQLTEHILNTNRKISAVDLDCPREQFKNELREFVRDHPEFREARYTHANTSIALIDRPDFEIGMGIIRSHSNEELFTLREARILELLHPGLISTAKTIAINRELKTYRALIDALLQVDAPLVLVREDGRVLLRNPAFHAVVQVEPGSTLPKELRDLVEQQITQLNPDRRPDTAAPPMAFYEHSEGTYRLNLTQLHPSGNEEAGSAWLVRLHPAADPYTLMNLNLQKAGLTPREVEITILAGDGFDDADIADRLFISPNTLKNHLKSIYKKLDVHSRTQLVARLRPSPDKLEV